MADHQNFDVNGYLMARYGDPNLYDRWQFQLRKLHEMFRSMDASHNSLRVLDFGCGPVIQHSISAVPYASEIVFCDISAANREAVKKWLRNEPDKFNWSPKFDYVVKTLEGEGEREAREREEQMRMVSKIALCDAHSDTPMENGFEGPYDVIIEVGCLDAACSEEQSYKRCLKRLTSILKPGGVFAHYTTNSEEVIENELYPVGDQWHSCMHFPADHVASLLKESGFKEIHTDFIPLDPLTPTEYSQFIAKTGNGYHFVSGKK